MRERGELANEGISEQEDRFIVNLMNRTKRWILIEQGGDFRWSLDALHLDCAENVRLPTREALDVDASDEEKEFRGRLRLLMVFCDFLLSIQQRTGGEECLCLAGEIISAAALAEVDGGAGGKAEGRSEKEKEKEREKEKKKGEEEEIERKSKKEIERNNEKEIEEKKRDKEIDQVASGEWPNAGLFLTGGQPAAVRNARTGQAVIAFWH